MIFNYNINNFQRFILIIPGSLAQVPKKFESNKHFLSNLFEIGVNGFVGIESIEYRRYY